MVTTHLYDGKKSLPLDIELYQHADSLPEGKEDPEFKKKPTLALGWGVDSASGDRKIIHATFM